MVYNMWKYFGVLFNTFTVTLGCCIALVLRAISGKKGTAAVTASTPDGEKLSDKMMECLGFVTIFAAASGLLEVESSIQALICVASMVSGYFIGWNLKVSDHLDALSEKVLARFESGKNENGKNPAEGFVTAFLLFCVGSMSILGSFESAANPAGHLELGCHTTTMIKALLDFTSSICLSISYGASIFIAGILLFLFQGSLVFLAASIQPFLVRINALPMINCVGSLLLLGISMNLLGIKKIKTADYLPALFMPILITWVITVFGGRV